VGTDSERLAHVRWIGGGSGAGKSTIARRLAARHSLHRYATDDLMSDHARRSTAESAPSLHAFLAMDMDERWLNRPPQTMLDTFHWYRGEGFESIVEDLVALPAAPLVVAEGFRLLPSLVEPLLADRRHAVWLVPTPEFRRAALERRGSLRTIAGATSNPEQALVHLLERDRMFTERVAAGARALGLTVIELDGSISEDELAARVSESFGLGDQVRGCDG
jgi:2-phosphoglycerate kinase